jgi:hypothetical protein
MGGIVGLRERQRRNRNDLAWYGAGFVLLQLALGLGIERYWAAVRDPEIAALERIVRDRLAEFPDRPSVLFLGSSRTRWGVHAELLNCPADPDAPLVLNCSVASSGPMLQAVVLRRMLKAGLRPALVVVEAMPMSVSICDGFPYEESMKTGRLTATEAARLRKYFEQPTRLYYGWLRARAFPCGRWAAELRDSLAVDVPASAPPMASDRYGWVTIPSVPPREAIDKLTRSNVAAYGLALTRPGVAPGAIQAYRDVVNFVRSRNIDVVLVMPPEANAMREASPAAGECHAHAIRDLAQELDVLLIDARAWIDDDGFWDGSHLTQRGADQYTARFAREVLATLPSPRLHWTFAPATDPSGF